MLLFALLELGCNEDGDELVQPVPRPPPIRWNTDTVDLGTIRDLHTTVEGSLSQRDSICRYSGVPEPCHRYRFKVLENGRLTLQLNWHPAAEMYLHDGRSGQTATRDSPPLIHDRSISPYPPMTVSVGLRVAAEDTTRRRYTLTIRYCPRSRSFACDY